MSLAEKMKESRLKMGFTQQEVSEKLFVTRQTISNWENNRSTPDIDTLVKISELYQINLDSLLITDQEMPNSEVDNDLLQETNQTIFYRIPYLLNLIVVILCVFMDFLTPTGTLSLWTSISHFLLLADIILLIAFFILKKKTLSIKTIVLTISKGLLILTIILGFTYWSNRTANSSVLTEIGHNYGHFIYLAFKATGILLIFDRRKFVF
ncbi:helix-turn-helix domain-containing protein [Enterococcus gallinarum]|uniref:Helix-turn-helix transcriptional regulator n=2 Tax=Enterococcus gallinarum TaxID=1353 RepID=A0ABD4ZNP5_ENTGA|nr:helix-turn-helix transcriptional regulator [Enterococcus gallinarum]MBF0820300.1 helix-turn-helix transcriptional regulator [Enterococcus faecalis]MBF0724560.1 helix-turn-helix transcriptional regulator [Enterococcus gallinarum]MBF0798063.1 helix-turn-helix transcriptional regulator [Enterococcus gallinarum]MDL4873661.1 helix-turn-helix transcriptional regulator [Enterococcus gallinarum]MDL4880178.1 helix-turn-helix transcriptional regulator [Enterococcus gallinarum]